MGRGLSAAAPWPRSGTAARGGGTGRPTGAGEPGGAGRGERRRAACIRAGLFARAWLCSSLPFRLPPLRPTGCGPGLEEGQRPEGPRAPPGPPRPPQVVNGPNGAGLGPASQEEAADELFYKQLGIVSRLLPLVLVGDFNLPDICWKYNTAERKQSRRFLECVEDNFLAQLRQSDRSVGNERAPVGSRPLFRERGRSDVAVPSRPAAFRALWRLPISLIRSWRKKRRVPMGETEAVAIQPKKPVWRKSLLQKTWQKSRRTALLFQSPVFFHLPSRCEE
ncbi:uncharacterized protein [Phaenicophaeus curvirostris]|uniref:uncharacterized protein n=1 Tax=Phaenicophaeus curvirostris TaxID=33595 RepID=UPI0037F09D0D